MPNTKLRIRGHIQTSTAIRHVQYVARELPDAAWPELRGDGVGNGPLCLMAQCQLPQLQYCGELGQASKMRGLYSSHLPPALASQQLGAATTKLRQLRQQPISGGGTCLPVPPLHITYG